MRSDCRTRSIVPRVLLFATAQTDLTEARQFQLFDLYVTQQWPLETVMSTLGVNAAQVYMAKMRVSRMIKGEVRLLKSQMR